METWLALAAAPPGRIVILNGVSRSGKSTLAKAIQDAVPGVWMNLGMDSHKACTPDRLQPGIGLRPGGHQTAPEIEEYVPVLFAGLYESVPAHSRLGLDVVMDVNHHERCSVPRGILADCARRLDGLPVLFVGVRCPVETIWTRRQETWGQSPETADASVRAAVELAQEATHAHGCYDLEVDTSTVSPEEGAALIGERLAEEPRGVVFPTLAAGGGL